MRDHLTRLEILENTTEYAGFYTEIFFLVFIAQIESSQNSP